MEVPRLLQVIKMVVMRWGERDVPNTGRKPEFGGGWWQSSGEARFFDEGLSKLFQVVMGYENDGEGFEASAGAVVVVFVKFGGRFVVQKFGGGREVLWRLDEGVLEVAMEVHGGRSWWQLWECMVGVFGACWR